MRHPPHLPALFALAAILALAPRAHAHSFNIDFGPVESTPAGSYAAAGIPGTWNSIGVLPPFERAPLVDVDGQPTGAQIYMFGGTSLLAVDITETTGDDEALIDDMLIGFCDPVDVCIWVENLVAGDYEVITYGLTPGEASRLCPVRVDFGTPGPTDVGGAWPGQHGEIATYARHLVTPTSQKIGLHSGTYNGYFQAGINGIQIRKVNPVPVGPGDAIGTSGIQRIAPNPSGVAQRIEFTLARPSSGGALEILDVGGRIVHHAALGDRPAGPQAVNWDGYDSAGHRVAAGIYFVRLSVDGAAVEAGVRKLVRV